VEEGSRGAGGELNAKKKFGKRIPNSVEQNGKADLDLKSRRLKRGQGAGKKNSEPGQMKLKKCGPNCGHGAKNPRKRDWT